VQFGLPPFEVEMRRRLWWQLVILDKRIGEMTGSILTSLSTGGDCKLPMNINDADLHMNAKEPPKAHSGPTEMLFALTRIELVCSLRPSPGINIAALAVPWNRYNGMFPSKGAGRMVGIFNRPDIAANLASQYIGTDIDHFSQHLEDTYLRQCDPKVPLHLFTTLMTRQAVQRRRILHYICPSPKSDSGSSTAGTNTIPGQVQRNADGSHLLAAIQTIEADTALHSSPDLRGLVWYAQMYFPFPAYMMLMHELRRVTEGEICERAWHTITENIECKNTITTFKSGRNPMFSAMGHLFVRAWDAHEERVRRGGGREIACPEFIDQLREMMKNNDAARETSAKAKMYGLGTHQRANGPASAPSSASNGSTAVNSTDATPMAQAHLPESVGSGADTAINGISHGMDHGGDLKGMGSFDELSVDGVGDGAGMDWNYFVDQFGLDFNMGGTDAALEGMGGMGSWM
jgi:hypothetical protein